MTTEVSPDLNQRPKPIVGQKPARNLAWVWLIPLIAIGVGLSILWREWSTKGPVISISFQSASGIEEGKTQVKFRDVVIGLVTDISLAQDRKTVLVHAQLDKDAESLANEGSQFWVVKPTVGVDGISGLSTLFSGSYIEADNNDDSSTKADKFTFIGLETPPPISNDRPGTLYRLRSPTLGSLQIGSPIYFLRIPVGVVSNYHLDPAGHFVDIDVFVDAPYNDYVTGSTRFWDESGVSVNFGVNGLTVETESLVSILAGGLAFASFGQAEPLKKDHVFQLFKDRAAAELVPVGIAIPIEMAFYQSTRGLEKGAPVEFLGVYLGSVESVTLTQNPETKLVFSTIKATVYPARLGEIYEQISTENRNLEYIVNELVSSIGRGMRAQLKTANLLSGSLYVDLIHAPETPINVTVSNKLPLVFPTIPSQSLDALQAQVSRIINSIDQIPFEKIGQDLQSALLEMTALITTLNVNVAPELSKTLENVQSSLKGVNQIMKSSQQVPGQLDHSLRELDRAVRAARQLIDELRERPNAIIFGEPSQPYSRDTLGGSN
jgi:paraquat-inducible protein B